MWNDEKDVEKYLSEFQPRQLPSWEPASAKPRPWMGRLAAAAVLALSVVGGLWYGRHSRSLPTAESGPSPRQETSLNRQRPNSIALTRLALEDEKQFEAQLSDESRGVLPDFHGSQSTLSVLAKD